MGLYGKHCPPRPDALPSKTSNLITRLTMPVVFRYKSFRFFFYSNEGNPRESMHIHVRSADGEAKFWLTPTIYLADSDGFDARTLRELLGIVTANKELFERSWNEYFA